MRKTNEIKEQRGITLIALIITIIIMLLLVAVTITMVVNGGLFGYASTAIKDTTIAQEKEKIHVGLTKIVIEQVGAEGDYKVTKEALENAIKTDADEVSVSEERPGDEYPFIVTFNGNQYGIKGNNEVEYLDGGIYNKYITVTYVNEATPKYLFEKTVTQENVDKEVNGSNVPYTIVGVLDEESGEYKTEGTIQGKSGELNIVDLQNTKFEYTLKDFFDGDDSFEVKILINDSVEKTQKLTVVQGYEVTYEENFNGLAYTGTWNFEEDENCSGGACAWTEVVGAKCLFSFTGSALNMTYVLDAEKSRMIMAVRHYSGKTSLPQIINGADDGVIKYNASFTDEEVLGSFMAIEGGASIDFRKVRVYEDEVGKVYLDNVIIRK